MAQVRSLLVALREADLGKRRDCAIGFDLDGLTLGFFDKTVDKIVSVNLGCDTNDHPLFPLAELIEREIESGIWIR
jgi:hypothetical protein